ncbi:MAG: hypothetical protein V1899_09175 [Planctomycetota bacterium]
MEKSNTQYSVLWRNVVDMRDITVHSLRDAVDIREAYLKSHVGDQSTSVKQSNA